MNLCTIHYQSANIALLVLDAIVIADRFSARIFAGRKEKTMQSNSKALKIVAFEDGSYAVVRADANPRFMEVVATFYDAKRAQEYVNLINGQGSEAGTAVASPASPAAPGEELEAANGSAPALSARQTAVLDALRAKMNDKNLVETKAAVLAEAAQVPLGSLHSILGSLEKKHLIHTARPGSPRAPAIYQVL